MSNQKLIQHHVGMARIAHHAALDAKRLGLAKCQDYWQSEQAYHMRAARQCRADAIH